MRDSNNPIIHFRYFVDFNSWRFYRRGVCETHGIKYSSQPIEKLQSTMYYPLSIGASLDIEAFLHKENEKDIKGFFINLPELTTGQ